jgi:hypothetical protein
MDKTIHKHLDNRMDIQESATKMLEEVLAGIDLKAVIANPKGELARVAHIAMGVTESHAKDAAEEGIRFAKETMAKGKVVVEPGKDPNLNEGELG